MTLFSSVEPEHIQLEGGELVYYREFLTSEESQFLYAKLENSLIWDQPNLQIGSRKIQIPRLQAWYGDEHTNYQYSGIQMTPHRWTQELQFYRQKICQCTKASFNSVLVNWYQHGDHSIGWHADNEPELGPSPVIAALSLGEQRRLRFRSNQTGEIFQIEPENGSLLVMQGDLQQNWKHQIPKSKKTMMGRISLTYRQIIKG